MNEQLHRPGLSALFRTEERIRLLRAVLSRDNCTVHQIASKTGLSKGLISPYLAMLEQSGLLSREGRTFTRNDSALANAIKRLLNVDCVTSVISKPEWVRGIGMYGSYAEGTDTDGSDLDLWVLADTIPSGTRVAELERDLSRALSTEVQVLVLTREKIAGMKQNDEPFYRSLLKQTITLAGDSFDTT